MNNILTRSIIFINFFIMGHTSYAQWMLMENSPLVVNALRFEDIYFTGRLHGSLVTATGAIFTTHDGGSSWTSFTPRQVYQRAVEYIHPDTGFVGSIDGALFKTVDGGESWHEITDLLPGNDKAICGISHVEGGKIWATGNYAGPAVLFISDDSGENWNKIELDSLLGGAVDVHFLNESTGFICGIGPDVDDFSGEGRILKTEDGGHTWRIVGQTGRSLTYVWKFDFTDFGHAYGSVQTLIGSLPAYLYSGDNGNTWTYSEFSISDGMAFDAQAIAFSDENTGWLAGYGEGIFRTSDAGLTWDRLPVTRNINRIFKVDSTYWVAAGFGVFEYSPEMVSTSPEIKSTKNIWPHRIVSLSPNPVADYLNLVFELDNSTQVRLDVYNITGKHMGMYYKGYLSAGIQQQTFDVSDYTSGQYAVVIRTHERHLSKTFIIR
jgi:photosystem II stability/assembly factor-like uncharacterized protein